MDGADGSGYGDRAASSDLIATAAPLWLDRRPHQDLPDVNAFRLGNDKGDRSSHAHWRHGWGVPAGRQRGKFVGVARAGDELGVGEARRKTRVERSPAGASSCRIAPHSARTADLLAA